MAVHLEQVVTPIEAITQYSRSEQPLSRDGVCQELDQIVGFMPELNRLGDRALKLKVCEKLTRTLNRRFVSDAVVSRVYNVAEAAFGKPLTAMPMDIRMHAKRGVDLHSENPFQEAMANNKRPLYASIVRVRGFTAESLISNFPIFLLNASRDEVTQIIHSMSLSNPEQMGILMASLLECNTKSIGEEHGAQLFQTVLLRSKLVMGYAHYYGIFTHQHGVKAGMKVDKEAFAEFSKLLSTHTDKVLGSLDDIEKIALSKKGSLDQQRVRLTFIIEDLESLLSTMKHIPQTEEVLKVEGKIQDLLSSFTQELHEVKLALEESEASEYEVEEDRKRPHSPLQVGDPSQASKRKREASRKRGGRV